MALQATLNSLNALIWLGTPGGKWDAAGRVDVDQFKWFGRRCAGSQPRNTVEIREQRRDTMKSTILPHLDPSDPYSQRALTLRLPITEFFPNALWAIMCKWSK
jgi:hypothetical protein